jgi:hypothetical protein
MWGNEKYGIGIPAEVMAHNMEGSDGITKGTGDFFGRPVFDEKSA